MTPEIEHFGRTEDKQVHVVASFRDLPVLSLGRDRPVPLRAFSCPLHIDQPPQIVAKTRLRSSQYRVGQAESAPSFRVTQRSRGRASSGVS